MVVNAGLAGLSLGGTQLTSMKGFWKRLRNINANRSVALAAVFISVCALYVSVQEMRLMRQQQKVSVYPHLSLSRHYTSEGFSVVVKNSGTGLAIVNSVQLTDGDRYFKNWPEMISHYMPDSLALGYDRIKSSSVNGEVLTPGEEVTLFEVDWLPGVRKLELATRDLKLRLCYSSLLEDNWILENETRWESSSACKKQSVREFD